jgi:hypothetical protein
MSLHKAIVSLNIAEGSGGGYQSLQAPLNPEGLCHGNRRVSGHGQLLLRLSLYHNESSLQLRPSYTNYPDVVSRTGFHVKFRVCHFRNLTQCLPRVEAGKNTSTVISASGKR